MMKRKTRVVDGLTKGVASLLKKNGITQYTGQAALDGNGAVKVTSTDESFRLEGAHILIATGSKPASLRGVELDGDRIGTSTEALNYPEVPQHLVIIGAGYIGLELGSVWLRLGARVTLVEASDRILSGMDSELAVDARKLFEQQGMAFQLNSKVTAARRQEDGCIVELKEGESIDCDRVLLAIGRVPVTEGLGLDQAGVQLDHAGRIKVDETYSTTAKGIYAIGDVIAGPMLAHKAEEEGLAFAEILVNGRGQVNYDAIPAIVYTHPELASVGKTEDELKAQDIRYRRGVFPFSANGRARTLGQIEGKVKILADERTDRVLGVHILGARAGDLIAEAAAAINFEASSEDIALTCHAHPTLSEALRESALAVTKRSLHT